MIFLRIFFVQYHCLPIKERTLSSDTDRYAAYHCRFIRQISEFSCSHPDRKHDPRVHARIRCDRNRRAERDAQIDLREHAGSALLRAVGTSLQPAAAAELIQPARRAVDPEEDHRPRFPDAACVPRKKCHVLLCRDPFHLRRKLFERFVGQDRRLQPVHALGLGRCAPCRAPSTARSPSPCI